MQDIITKLLEAPCGTNCVISILPRDNAPGLGAHILAVHAPAELAGAAGPGGILHCAMSLSVVAREGITFFFFGMCIEGTFYMFTVNPGEERLLALLKQLEAGQVMPVLLAFDEKLAAITMQSLPKVKLEAALKVARRKPTYAPEKYNRVLTALVSERSQAELAQSLFSQQELADLMLQAHLGRGATVDMTSH